MNKFFNDFNYFWGMIEKGENFTFSRYADGEVMLMSGKQVNTLTQAYRVDNWSAPNVLTQLGKDLLSSLNHTEENYYYAISASNDNINDYNFLTNNIKQSRNKLTFVNLWINANYQKSIQKYALLKRDVILICNNKAKQENFTFTIKDITEFPNDCVSFWEENGVQYIDMLIKKYGNMNNQLFFISCGPASEVIIDKLYSNNPNNTYIDVGSSIDEFVHGYKTRPYMDPTSRYSKLISIF